MAPRTAATSILAAALWSSGVSQAELARRAGMPRSVLNAYLRGSREPGATALSRIVGAAGRQLRVERAVRQVDLDRAGRLLVQVLGLAEALPARRRGRLTFPSLRSLK